MIRDYAYSIAAFIGCIFVWSGCAMMATLPWMLLITGGLILIVCIFGLCDASNSPYNSVGHDEVYRLRNKEKQLERILDCVDPIVIEESLERAEEED